MTTRQNHADAHAQRQLFFVQRIYEKREVLFGRRDRRSLAVQQGPSKEEEWEQLRKECVANGMSELADKSYKHLRDVTWQYFLRRVVAKWKRIKNKPKGEEELTDCEKLALTIVIDLAVAPNYQQAPDYNHEEEPAQVQTAHVPQVVVQPTAVNRHVPNGTIGSSNVDTATAEREEAVLKSLRRKRQIADIRNVDAQTERLLADAEKLRAEAKLARMQAAAIETRLQLNGTPAARLRESSGENDVVE
ncbi:hypothetical protein M3Y99_01285100 [Aphelenchoides fujianensis]|nr:hypothetical protein M3Y99_01285100 [Aphelenchoides fujianensis]